jgi:hypothetical protein
MDMLGFAMLSPTYDCTANHKKPLRPLRLCGEQVLHRYFRNCPISTPWMRTRSASYTTGFMSAFAGISLT